MYLARQVRSSRYRRHGWWPMGGWLTELDAAGAVEFDPTRDVLRIPAGRSTA